MFKKFIKEEDGIGTVEIVLILVALVAIALLFKNTVQGYVNTLFKKIDKDI